MKLVSALHLMHECKYSPIPESLLENPRDVEEEGTKGFAMVEVLSRLDYRSLGEAVPQAILQVGALAKKQK